MACYRGETNNLRTVYQAPTSSACGGSGAESMELSGQHTCSFRKRKMELGMATLVMMAAMTSTFVICLVGSVPPRQFLGLSVTQRLYQRDG